MSDIPDRDQLERQLSRKLGKLNRVQIGRLLEYLGDPPLIANVPASFWDEAGRELAQALSPFLEDVYVQQSLELMNSQPIGIDWAVVNEGAVNWARDYSFNLVSGINDTSRTALQATVGAYYERGQTIGELTDRLSGIFGPVRAEMIAVTEITRASVEGERAIVRELNKQGVQMVPIWQTNNDSLVCPLCGPRHNKEIKDGVYPPIHPRCRCWVNHELPKVEKPRAQPSLRPTVTAPKFKTYQEAAAWAEQNIADRVGYTKYMNIDGLNQINQSVYEMQTRFGLGKLGAIGNPKTLGIKVKFGSRVTAGYLESENALLFKNIATNEAKMISRNIASNNACAYKSVDSVINFLEASGGSKDVISILETQDKRIWTIGEGKIEDLISHELGHQIHYKFPDADEINNIIRPAVKQGWGRTLSEYANTNYYEYFAESFTAYTMGRHSIINPDLLAYFRRIDGWTE